MEAAVVMVASYLLGAVPFGLLVGRLASGVDVRAEGSGNIGATNVLRVAGKPAGALVMALDVGKGLLPAAAAGLLGLGTVWQVAAGLAAIIGHMYSPFLGMKGGKGIATSLGVLLGALPPVGVTVFVLWGAVVAATGYVSLASVLAAASLPWLSAAAYPGDVVRMGFVCLAAVLATYRHRANLVRLCQGTESCFRRTRPGTPVLIVTIAVVVALVVCAAPLYEALGLVRR
ncbi:MAG TPA: glycerol-3-phosphate 1-O-acyltransferase PlsY [Chthonomonadales bacterium]|nr:glycerol-3-phosphate 1-O-acyltransferase PlsY [Chthonomonadales bacterium]